MSNCPRECDERLLEMVLRGELPPEKHEGLLLHLDTCSSCQQHLEELAASDRDWATASEAIKAREKSLSISLMKLPSDEPSPAPPRWTDSLAGKLLSPPLHPEMLGRLGRYEIERHIGSGGMGLVFKGYDQELNRPVAIKLLAPHLADSGSARQRFSREARAAAAVVHSHVVPIHSVETECELPYFVMQFVSGESLQERIDRVGPLELEQVLRIGLQVADGLAAAHQQGVVHRDIKPSNILLESGVDRALITDFGLARVADDANLTRSGMHPGTPHYMSPEQVAGGVVDGRSDLFSLGSMFYTMSTGRPPFRSSNSLGVLRMITDAAPRPMTIHNSRLPDWWLVFVERLMSKDPDHRFQSAGMVKNLLEECLRHLKHPAIADVPRVLQRPHRFSSILPNILSAGFAIAAMLLFGHWALQGHDEHQEVSKSSSIEDPLYALVRSLDRGRGDWVGALSIDEAGENVECNATFKLEGDAEITHITMEEPKNIVRPDFRISIAWPRENPSVGATIEIRTGTLFDAAKASRSTKLKPTLRDVTVRTFDSHEQVPGGDNRQYFGVTWDPTTRKLNCNPLSVRLAEDEKTLTLGAFTIEVTEKGMVKIHDMPLKDNLKISGMLTARIGKWIEQSVIDFDPGYQLTKSSTWGVCLTDSVILDIERIPQLGMYHITLFGQEGETAFGLIEAPQDRSIADSRIVKELGSESNWVPGYFWIDKKTHSITRGLNAEEFRASMRKRGISEPQLHNWDLLWKEEFLPLENVFPWYSQYKENQQ